MARKRKVSWCVQHTTVKKRRRWAGKTNALMREMDWEVVPQPPKVK